MGKIITADSRSNLVSNEIILDFYRIASGADSSSVVLYYHIANELKPPEAIEVKIRSNFLRDLAGLLRDDDQDRSTRIAHPFVHRFLRVEAATSVDPSENMLLFYDGYRPIIKVAIEAKTLERLTYLRQDILDPNLLALNNIDQDRTKAAKLILRQRVEARLANWREGGKGIFLADASAREISDTPNSRG